MKNADKPAMPQSVSVGIDGSLVGSYMEDEWQGLTKREELAARNMAAILSSLPHWEAMGYKIESDTEYAKQAIDAADALLAKLDK